MSETEILIAGSAIVGLMLIVWRNKRQFTRLNQFGIEQFASYGHKVRAIALDVLPLGGGYGLLGAAGIIFAVEYAQPLLSILCVLSVIWVIQAVDQKSKR